MWGGIIALIVLIVFLANRNTPVKDPIVNDSAIDDNIASTSTGATSSPATNHNTQQENQSDATTNNTNSAIQS